jgi:ADP-heptose:LPS heptosyltransferase
VKRLLIRPGAIGDCIVSLPALESLRVEYTEVWVARPNVPLIRFADRVRAIPDTGLDWLEIRGADSPPALLEALAGFDSIVSWYGANRENFRETVRGLGFPFRLLDALPAEGNCHAVDFYLDQARVIGGAAVEPVPRIPVEATREDFVVIHPFSGSPAKNWPLEKFRELAASIEGRVEWCAGPEEELAGARRFDDLYELGQWLTRARLYIGNDSGVTHLAAAVGTPVVAIFGPTDPGVWGPRGRTVKIVRAEGGLDGLPVSAVANSVI